MSSIYGTCKAQAKSKHPYKVGSRVVLFQFFFHICAHYLDITGDPNTSYRTAACRPISAESIYRRHRPGRGWIAAKQCCGSGSGSGLLVHPDPDPVFLVHPDPDPDPGKYRIRILYPQKDPCNSNLLVI